MAFIQGAITDKSSFAYCVESSPGTAGTNWEYLEINSPNSMGETIGTTERNPISNDRMRRKGGVTSLDSAVGFDADLTYSLFDAFAQGFWFASWNEQTSFVPTAVTTGGYTVTSGGDIAAGTLVYARNYLNDTNNGLQVTDTSTGATTIDTVATLVAEASPPSNARVDVVGFQGASGDIVVDSDGNLTSTTLDFTTLGIEVGQRLYIGGTTTATQFATAGVGFVRVKVVEANKLTIDEQSSATWAADAGTGKTIQIFIGSFIKNVAYDDSDFLEETYTFEVIYDWTTPEYHYPNGNYANEMSIVMNTEDKATVSYGFVGLDTPVPTTSRKSGTWTNPVDTTMLNTTSDFARLSIKAEDGTEILASSDCAMQDLTVTINNGVQIKKGLGCLGGVMAAFSNFNVDISGTMYFLNSNAIVAIRDNDTVGLDFCLENENGGIYIEIPSMTLGDGSRDFPANDTINVNLTGMAFKDTFFNTAMMATKFPFLPV